MGPLALPLMVGAGSLISGLLSGRKKTTTSTQKSTTMPTFDPAFGPLRDMLMRRIQTRAGQNRVLDPAIGNQMIANSNQVFGNLGQSSRDRLAASGTSGQGSGIAEASARNLDVARGGSIVQGLNSLPLLQNQMENQDLGMATDFLGMGRGSTTEGTGTQTQPQDLLGGLGAGISDFGAFLGQMYGSGMLGSKAAGPGLLPQLQPNFGRTPWHRYIAANRSGGY